MDQNLVRNAGAAPGSSPSQGRSPYGPARRGIQSGLWAYAVAVLGVALATYLTHLLIAYNYRATFALFYAAVAVAAWYGGIGPGLLATALAVLASNYFFLPPFYTFRFDLPGLVQLTTLALVALLTTLMADSRRRAEAAAHRQREQLQVTLTSIGDAVIVTDAAGRVTFMNPVAQELTGWDLAEALGRPLEQVFAIISESSREIVESPVVKVLREGAVVGLANHTLLVRRDGREVPIDDSGAPIRDETGQINGVVLVFRDISERRQAEQRQAELVRENRQQRQFLERLVEHVPAGIAVLQGPDHSFSLANPGYLKMTAGKGDILNRSVAEVWPELINVIGPLLDSVYQTGESFYGVDAPFRIRREDGWQDVYFTFSYTRLTDEQGRPEGILVLVQDTTAEVKARQEREEADALLDTVFVSAPVGLAFVDRELRFVRVNEALARMNGQPVAGHLGRTLAEMWPDNTTVAGIMTDWRHILETGEPMLGVEVSSTLYDPPGQMNYWLANWYPVHSDGEIIGVGIVAQDVTERRRDEQAQRLLAEAGRLLAGSLDTEATLANVAELLVPHLADWCTVHLGRPEEGVEQVAIAHVDPAKIELAHELQRRYPPNWDAPAGLPNVLRTGQSELYPNITDDMLEQTISDPELLRDLRRFQIKSQMIVPMVSRDRVLGAISLTWAESGYHHDEQDLALAEELARRAALALERAQLYGEAQAELAARRQVEQQLKASLAEKEVLLKEVHHRVKNNLQAISNLLYLQSAYTPDAHVREMLQQTQDRVKSIALIHEKLYQTQDLGQLDFAEYARNLVEHLIHSYRIEPDTIRLTIRADGVPLDMDTSVPLGVIINELVSNSLKYAFPADVLSGSSGNGHNYELKIELRAEADGRLLLVVSDNGVGLPVDQDIEHSSTLGLQLVHLLSSYMNGTVAVEREKGTTFKISFDPKPGATPEPG